MIYAVILLLIVCLWLCIYIVRIQVQLRSINHQLKKRTEDQNKQLLTLPLQNKELIELTANVNRCLKAEGRLLIQARQNEREFKQLIASISHDLRTPLTAIRGYLQLVERGTLTEQERKNLQVALKYTHELGQFIDHFFEYSYLLDAKPEMRLETFQLNKLVVQCIADSVALFEEKGIQVQVEEGPPVMVYADREMTIRILQNLIRNCIAHSEGDLTVMIDADEAAKLHFCNPVSSMVPIDPEKLFERFFTGDATRNRTTGLGLSIVKLLSENMGGSAKAVMKANMLEIIISLPLIKKSKGEIDS